MPQDTLLKNLSIDFAASLAAGVTVAGAFNPYDRALYLSVKNNRPFLDAKNFRHPYQGFLQAVLQRTYTGGLYFFMQSELRRQLLPALKAQNTPPAAAQFLVGTAAGSATAIMSNGLAAVKYHTWGQDNRALMQSIVAMWRDGGLTPFFRGTSSTLARDMTFGAVYELMRHQLRQINQESTGNRFVWDCSAALTATIASAMFNYARTKQYATQPSETAPSIWSICKALHDNSKQYTGLERARFFQQRLRLGWGTGRVGLGMAAGQYLFDETRARLSR